MRLSKGRLESYRLFTRFFRAYLLILIIPLVASSAIYLISIRALKEDVALLNQSVLRGIQTSFEERKAAVRHIPHIVMENTQVRRFAIHKQIGQEDYYELNQIVSQLSVYSLYENVIDDIIVCFNNSGTVLYNGSIYKKDWFFGQFFQYNGYSAGDWERLLSIPDMGTFYPFSPLSLISSQPQKKMPDTMLYIQSFGDYYSVCGTFVIAMIGEEQISQPFEAIGHGDSNSIFLVLDGEGKMLYSNGGVEALNLDALCKQSDSLSSGYFPYQLDGVPYTAVCASSDLGWKYIALLPDQQLYVGVEYLRIMSLIFLFLGICLGLTFSVYFSSSNTKPIRDISSILHRSLQFSADTETYDLGRIKFETNK